VAPRCRYWPPSVGHDQYGAYDLRKDSRDVCITITGNPVLGVGVLTNKVVIPQDAISAALKAAQP
jgi:hypothetical protein